MHLLQGYGTTQGGRFAQECPQIVHQVYDPVTAAVTAGMGGDFVTPVQHHETLGIHFYRHLQAYKSVRGRVMHSVDGYCGIFAHALEPLLETADVAIIERAECSDVSLYPAAFLVGRHA